MALKALMLKRRLDLAQKAREELRAKDADFAKREAELEASIAEVGTEEERAAVDEAVAAFESEKAAHDEAAGKLEEEIRGLETELSEIESKQEIPAPPVESAPNETEERKVEKTMEIRTRFRDMTIEQRTAFVKREEVAGWLGAIRALKGQQRAVTNGDLTIPEVVLPLLYTEAEKTSQLIGLVYTREIRGTGRQVIMGAVPEAVWTEMCANINEIDLGFNDIEVDGFKVAGFIKICNALLDDSDVNLAGEIITALGAAIGKALVKAILFGTGTKMPLGIATRLAQTSQPENYPAKAPAWADLHTSNIQTLNLGSTRGAEFFESLVLAAAAAKKNGTNGKMFWAMNRKTHLTIMAKALAFNAAAALTAGVNNEMPVVGGQIVEIDTVDMQDYEIIGGFGQAYVLAQRQGATFGVSDQRFFVEDQTAFRGVARYDGKPAFADSFVIINFNNTSPTTEATFADDYANTDLGTLTVTAAAHGSTSGKTVLTVTGTEASGTTLKYKIGDIALTEGQKLDATWTSLTSGSTGITAAAGTVITVAELDGKSRVIKRGQALSVPKA